MANSRAELSLGHTIVNLKNKKQVYNTLYDLIGMDNDLTENEDYFREDTLELGFDNDAERYVKEALEKFGQPTNAEEFKKVAEEVFEAISQQDYFGLCELNVIQISKNKLSLAYATGGDYGW